MIRFPIKGVHSTILVIKFMDQVCYLNKWTIKGIMNSTFIDNVAP